MEIDAAAKTLYLIHRGRPVPFADLSLETRRSRGGKILKVTLVNPGEMVLDLGSGREVPVTIRFGGEPVLRMKGEIIEENQKEG